MFGWLAPTGSLDSRWAVAGWRRPGGRGGGAAESGLIPRKRFDSRGSYQSRAGGQRRCTARTKCQPSAESAPEQTGGGARPHWKQGLVGMTGGSIRSLVHARVSSSTCNGTLAGLGTPRYCSSSSSSEGSACVGQGIPGGPRAIDCLFTFAMHNANWNECLTPIPPPDQTSGRAGHSTVGPRAAHRLRGAQRG